MLYKSLTFEAVILIITSVNDFNMWYFISLMIKEDIPYPEFRYLLQLMVQTLNETAIYHIQTPYSTRDGAKHVFINKSIFL